MNNITCIKMGLNEKEFATFAMTEVAYQSHVKDCHDCTLRFDKIDGLLLSSIALEQGLEQAVKLAKERKAKELAGE